MGSALVDSWVYITISADPSDASILLRTGITIFFLIGSEVANETF